MDFNIGSKKIFFTTILLSSIILILSLINSHKQGSFIVFCDVGQGDAAYVRIENKIDVLIDAGPNREVLNCLGRHMPFYDREIDIAFISHPQIDHYGGYKEVIKRYKIKAFVIAPVINPNQSYPELIDEMKANNILIKQLYDDDSIVLSSHAQVKYLWPSHQYATNKVSLDSDNRDNLVLGTTTEDLNAFSEIFILSINEFDVIFTGDALPETLSQIVNDSDLTNSTIEVLKVPHHGSKNGLTRDFLYAVKPELSVISYAKKNRYGHPHASTIEMLKAYGKPYIATANEGDVVIDIKDSGWSLEKDAAE